MSIDEIVAEALKLEPEVRARIATRLLESAEGLSGEESTRLWVKEARRRAADLDASPQSGRSGDQVFRDARAGL